MRTCKWCGTAIIYLTTPNEKKMCIAVRDMSLIGVSKDGKIAIEAVAHQATCEPFKRQKKIEKIDKPP